MVKLPVFEVIWLRGVKTELHLTSVSFGPINDTMSVWKSFRFVSEIHGLLAQSQLYHIYVKVVIACVVLIFVTTCLPAIFWVFIVRVIMFDLEERLKISLDNGRVLHFLVSTAILFANCSHERHDFFDFHLLLRINVACLCLQSCIGRRVYVPRWAHLLAYYVVVAYWRHNITSLLVQFLVRENHILLPSLSGETFIGKLLQLSWIFPVEKTFIIGVWLVVLTLSVCCGLQSC